MKTLSKKLQDLLFGKSSLEGGLPVVANMTCPQPNKSPKKIEWDGNKGLILYMIERIENLEKEVSELSANKKRTTYQKLRAEMSEEEIKEERILVMGK